MTRFAVTLLLLLGSLYSRAQKPETIADKTKNMTHYHGYFNFYWDDVNGKIWLEIDKLNQEFLYVNSMPAGLGSNDIGLDRGQIGDSRIVYFNRVGKKVLIVQPNYDYRAVNGSLQEQEAVKQSFASSVIGSFAVEAESEGTVLVDATSFLLRDAHGVADRLRNMKQGSYTLNESRSAIYLQRTKNFPLNTEFESTITFSGGSDAGRYVRSVTPSPEAITVRLHHSFVQLPDSGYTPRPYDIRSGYFGITYFDYSSPFTQPIEKMFISRHRLTKKDPLAPMSEPVKPITYYLDNGTPEPIRSALLDGARWWNEAFEAAGYINAFQVKVLPNDADPMDIRYNTINWVHRSTRGWSYGATITDPRTGEIIKGQVTLGSLRVRQDYLIFTGLLSPFETGKPAPETMKQAALQRLRQLAAHEVGHTLGLQHNYASSVNSRASVMDYPSPSLFVNTAGKIDFSNAYTNSIGQWDKRAIMYGYSQFNGGSEPTSLKQLVNENTREGLLFIADADARDAAGMHPNAHLWDNGTSPVEELKNVLQVRQKALENFSENAVADNVPLAKLEDALVPVYNFHRYQLEAVCKLIGGMQYSYSVKGGNQQAPQVLPATEQQLALRAALQCLSPQVLTLPQRIVQLIPPRPPMYYGVGELFNKRSGRSFDALSAAEALADYELEFLFNDERANRLVQFKAQAGTPGWDDVLDAIINATWKAPLQKGMEQQIQLQTAQMVLTHLLSLSMNDNANYAVKAICNDRLQSLKQYANAQAKTNQILKAHFNYAVERINHPKDIPKPRHEQIAPGPPIGCDMEF